MFCEGSMVMDEKMTTMDSRPRLLMVYSDSGYAVQCSRSFRRSGWEVHLAASGDEACRMIGRLDPTAVVVDAELQGELGWKTCERITAEFPGLRVVLLAADETAPQRLESTGAGVRISRRDNVEVLAQQLVR